MFLSKSVFRGVIFFCLTINSCATLFFKSNSKIDIQPQKCIMKIVTKYFPCNTLVNLFYYKSDFRYLTGNINSKLCYNVIVRSVIEATFLHLANQYILLSRDLPGLRKMISLIKMQDKYWNPRSNFIVYVEKVTNSDMKYVFETLLDYNMHNVVVLVRGNCTSIYTYFPFHDGNCGKTIGDVRSLGNCENFAHARDCFPNKFTNGLRNCTVSVGLLQKVPNVIFSSSNHTIYGKYIPGTEQYLLNNIAALEGLNLQYIYSKEKFGGLVLPNGTATALLHFLETGRADIVNGAMRLVNNRADVFDYAWGAHYITYCLFTSTKRDPDWEKFYKEFDSTTWLLILISYALVVIVCVLNFNLSRTKSKSSVRLFFQLYGFFFIGNGSTTLLAQKQLRIILACWIWLTFFVSNFYSTDLYSLMSTHAKQIKLGNEDNLINMPFKPCLAQSLKDFFQVNYNFNFAENAFDECSIPGKALDMVALNTGLFTIDTKESYVLNEYKYIDDYGNRMVDVLDFSGDYVIVSYLTRGFPLRDTFQKHALHFFENGLLKRHLETLTIHSRSLIRKKTEFRIFQLNDLRVHFFVLGFGSSLATIAFIVEMLSKTKKVN